jgi:hypothetical protein
VAVFLWIRISAVDGFYLDEWLYVHGAQHIWDGLPGGLLQGIPGWDRGPQRLYVTLISPIWGPFGASTAFTISHLLNVLLLSSAIVPAALFARRVIDSPVLRILAVALGVVVPWLFIGAHLLAENLGFPIFVWTVYAIVRAADAPSLWRQIVALAAILAGTLSRLNLASMLVVFIAAVIAAEVLDRRQRREEPFGEWARSALRREALVLAAAVVGIAGALVVLGSGASSLGRYGIVDLDLLISRLVGDQGSGSRRMMVAYARSLVLGTLILPFVLGIAVGLAGTFGRLGRRLVIPSVVGLSAFLVTVIAVAVYTFVVPEERYVFFVITPVALLGVAALEHLDQLRRWIAAASAFALWILITGTPMSGDNAGHFFAAPAGAFWTRVVDHRLRSIESDLASWTLLAPTGWLLVALGLICLVAWVSVGRRWGRARIWVLAGALGLCLAGQIAVLWYSSKQELYGTSTAPGGIALSGDRAADREKWIDAALPDDVAAAALPGLVTAGTPTGYGESMTFWSKDLNAIVATPWNGNPAPQPVGDALDVTALDDDGLAAWQGAPPAWLATQRDDPRVQFAGRVAGRAPFTPFEVRQLTGAPRAVWTAAGLGANGALASGASASLALDREQARDVRRVVLTLYPANSEVPTRWRIRRGDRTVAQGTTGGNETTDVPLAVPACGSSGACAPAVWQMTVERGTGADRSSPASVVVTAARLER